MRVLKLRRDHIGGVCRLNLKMPYPWEYRQVQDHFANEQPPGVGCLVNGELVGFLLGRQRRGVLVIERLGIEDRHRRQRIASRLIEAALSAGFWGQTCERVESAVPDSLLDVHLFYQACGLVAKPKGDTYHFTAGKEACLERVRACAV